MIIELFIMMEIVMIGVFLTSFFTKQEILWALSLVLSGILMITSYNVEIGSYAFNPSTRVYTYELVSNSFPFMMGINLLFFSLTVLLGLLDLFDKYGIPVNKKNRGY